MNTTEKNINNLPQWFTYEEAVTWLIENVKPMTVKRQFRDLHRSGGCPEKMPFYPEYVYRVSGWIGWSAFLSIKPKNYRSYEDAKAYVQSLCPRLIGLKGWHAALSDNLIPTDIPTNPKSHYRNSGWEGMEVFLGNRVTSKKKDNI